MNESLTVQPAAPHATRDNRAPLHVDHAVKRIDGHEILRGISFTVRPREFVALLGASGAGKTTLLRCVTGLTDVDRGTISVAGQSVASLRGRARRHVAVISQQFDLVRRLSALDNVLAGRLGHVSAWRGIARCFTRSDRLLALECLERVGLLEFAWRRVDTLSGGQQQRVAIARALAQQPDLIVADEPVSSLDPGSGTAVLDLLRACCHDQGLAVLCSLHQVGLAVEFADRIVGLTQGTISIDIPAPAFGDTHANVLYPRASGR
ncbi:phosphonate ABC transporter ATP-binding protein [Burkholderia sp.]|uniref:phosphonate ABC transporter ATP-binding protein n=1 Tax=Burkholderia sp. TaxID=36773 RepID=UPI0025BF1530|nr:phosphonate ABC transporter ATP-binding protein [Burkholderia sp.]MBS6360515.1 phosphonate ABC transporter ATP-binding protein [Burkholderia sp.]